MGSWRRRVACSEGLEGRGRGGARRWPAGEHWADRNPAQLRPLSPLPWGGPAHPLARGACGGREANLGLRWGWGGGLHLHPSQDGNCCHPAKIGAGETGGYRSPSHPPNLSRRRRRRRGRSVTRPQETRRSNT